VGAKAATKHPISKTNIVATKTHLRSKNLYALAQGVWNAASARKKAELYQPTSARELNSVVIDGTALAMILCSGNEKC
jgi:hypothetical protein